MNELQTILGEDIPVTTRGIVYFGKLGPTKLEIKKTIMCNSVYEAFEYYANTPNPESQLITGNTFDELIKNLHILHQWMEDKHWIEMLHESI